MHLLKNKMRVFIDADGCPVTESAVILAEQYDIECYVVCDTSHEFSFENAKVITVSKGKDSADYKIVNLTAPGDILVTQDFGLAAMCLAKNVKALNQNGLIYTDRNIDGLLQSRHISREIRMSGGRTKGPHKRKGFQNEDFLRSLKSLIENK